MTPVDSREQLGGKQICREKPGDPGGQQAAYETEECSLWQSGVLGWIRQRLGNRSRDVILPTPREMQKLWLFSLEKAQWESRASL